MSAARLMQLYRRGVAALTGKLGPALGDVATNAEGLALYKACNEDPGSGLLLGRALCAKYGVLWREDKHSMLMFSNREEAVEFNRKRFERVTGDKPDRSGPE